jgi:hypothetical protein
MQLADELFREKDLHQRFRRRVGDRLETLRRALDDHEQRLAALHEQPRGVRIDSMSSRARRSDYTIATAPRDVSSRQP